MVEVMPASSSPLRLHLQAEGRLRCERVMDIALGVLLGIGLVAVAAAVWRLLRAAADRPTGSRDAVGAARRDLDAAASAPRAAPRRAPRRRVPAPASADRRRRGRARRHAGSVLAIDGEGREQVRPGDLLSQAAGAARPTTACTSSRGWSPRTRPARCARRCWRRCVVQGRRAGTLIAFYRAGGPASQRASCGSSRRRRASSPRRSSCRSSPSRRSGWRRPSCGRCARRSRRTSSTTRSPPSPATSTPAPRRRASC